MNTKITFRSLDELRKTVAQKKKMLKAITELNINPVDSEKRAEQLDELNFDVKKKLCLERYNLN